MRPVLGRDRLPEEIPGRRVEGVVEGDEASVARENGPVREFDLLRKSLEGVGERDGAVAVVDRADEDVLVGGEEQDRLARRGGGEDLVYAELILSCSAHIEL